MNDNENKLITPDDNSNNNLPPSEFTSYNNEIPQQNKYQESTANEVAYYPVEEPPKKKKKRILLKSVLAIVCVFAISIGSVLTYVELVENGYNIPFISTGEQEDEESPEDEESLEDDEDNISNKKNKNLPSLLQMAAREDALSIPEIVQKVTPSVVGISSQLPQGMSTGTGIVMTKDGYIITNAHVVEDATAVTVAFIREDKTEEVKATIIGVDAKTDLAVIKIEKDGLTPAEFGLSEDLMVGELAIAIGNPLGFDLANSVTGGIISALNRELVIDNKNLTLIQTDAAINSGNSGGPLVNSYGQVIGINSAKIQSVYGGVEGLGFAISIDEAKPIIDQLIQYGYVTGRPMLGIGGQNITASQARFNNIPQGIFVVTVTEDTGADLAGIKPGDIITAVNDKAVLTMTDLSVELEEYKAGDRITISYYRDGKNYDTLVTLTENKQ